MSPKVKLQWHLALALLIAVALFLFVAVAVRAESVRVFGLVQDLNYLPVVGGTIRIEHMYDGLWYVECEDIDMQSSYFGCDLTKDGNYQVVWTKPGYQAIGIDRGEFKLPGGAPSTDIVVRVRLLPTRIPTATSVPVPTTLMPPTVNPTATGTPKPCLSFQQFNWSERRSILDDAARHMNESLEEFMDWDNDLTLLHGLREQLLGAPHTQSHSTMGLTWRAFCNGILVMRPESRGECVGYGVITWDGTQNWEGD